MPKLTIVYGVVDKEPGAGWIISFPDAPAIGGLGNTREQAIDDGAANLRQWVERERKRGRVFVPRSLEQVQWDDAVQLALKLGMELVAVPL